MKIKLNTDLKQYKSGAIINIETDSKGIPLDVFWRARLKDSEIDNCIEKVQEEKIEVKPTTSNKKRVK